MKTFRIGIGDSLSLLLRIAFVAFFAFLAFGLTYWQTGATRNSWEAQLSARAATLANAPWTRDRFPELSIDGDARHVAEVVSPDVSWRSPNHPSTPLLPTPPPEPGELFKTTLRDAPCFGVTLLVPRSDGVAVRTTYFAPTAGYTAQWTRILVINSVLLLLPAVLLAVVWPARS